MKKVLLMACAATMFFTAGTVYAAQQQAAKGVKSVEQKTAMVKVTETKVSCKVGSHVSHKWIKERNKNCTKCGTQKDSKGKKVFYCYCDCSQKTKCPKGYDMAIEETTGKVSCEKTVVEQPDPKCPKGYVIAVNAQTGKKSCECTGYLLKDKTCAPCPTNAAYCNGKTVTCAKGYVTGVEIKTGKTTCECEGYMTTARKCAVCPTNATCDGKTATCKKGFTNVNAKKDGGVVRCEKSKKLGAK